MRPAAWRAAHPRIRSCDSETDSPSEATPEPTPEERSQAQQGARQQAERESLERQTVILWLES